MQINENAKAPAAWNVFPEVNHNETVGWEAPQDVNRRIHLILLRDAKDEVRIHQRVELVEHCIEGA